MILWFLHYHNIGEGDIFQTSKKTFFLPTEHSEAVGLIALGSCGWWKLSWVQRVIRQTHSRKIWINTKTPLLAQEASELQFVKRPVKDSGNASLYACPVLRFISKHLLLFGHCPKQTLDSALSSTAVTVAVKSPNCEERETMENWEGGRGSDNWLQGWIGPARSSWEVNGYSGITHEHLPPLKYLYFVKSGFVQMALDFLRAIGQNYTVLSREVCCSSLKQQNKPCRLNKGT